MARPAATLNIVARSATGKEATVALNASPFFIGSGEGAHLVLDDEKVASVHATVRLNAEGELLLTGSGRRIAVNGRRLSSSQPFKWTVHDVVSIGSYALQVVEQSPWQHYSNERKLGQQGALLAVAEDRAGYITHPDDTSIDGGYIPDTDDAVVLVPVPDDVAEESGTLPYVVPEAEELYLPNDEETRPKEWIYNGLLGVQFMVHPINLVPGERIRIPVSVHNNYSHTLDLSVTVSGLPPSWRLRGEPQLQILPTAVMKMDLIVETVLLPGFTQLDARLHLQDRKNPELEIDAPFTVNLKRVPDVTANLLPAELTDGETAFFTVDNHTQVTVIVEVAGLTDDPHVYIEPPRQSIKLLPGQNSHVRLRLDARARPLLWPRRAMFWVVARQGNRAPLDFPARLILRPRFGRFAMLMAGLLLGVLLFVVLNPLLAPRYQAALLALGGATSTPTLTPSATATVTSMTMPLIIETEEATASPTATSTQTQTVTLTVTQSATATATATVTPTATQSATATATVTVTPSTTSTRTGTATTSPVTPATRTPLPSPIPRRCDASVPPNWLPYTVAAGDNLILLAVQRGILMNEIVQANCLRSLILEPGQNLLLPPIAD